ncbi:MAG: YfiR family protein [Rickettsiales bacterium]|nr:YfiR family protein [Rickettsiales bacterium]
MIACFSRPMAWAGVSEYQLKSIFLINFTDYIEWPEHLEHQTKRICTFGEDPFDNNLDIINDQAPEHLRSKIKRNISFSDIKKCHIVFISQSQELSAKEVIDRIKGLPILTVGQTKKFIKNGGMIQFDSSKDNINIIINYKQAIDSNLVINANLLNIASKVYR